MADEATLTVSLRIAKGNLIYQSFPQAFTADMTGTKGPTPGAITATTVGTLVDLSQLTQPGLCRLMNLDASNYVTVGMYDPQTLKFYPLLELLPGETFPLRLSRDLAEEYGTSPGTGTTGQANNRLMVRANAASCVVLVEAFES